MSLNVSHEESSLVNGDHSSLVFSKLQFSLRELFGQFLLRGPRLRTIIHDVFVSYLKNWQWSQIAPIIQISCSCNSCILKASHDCTYVFANRSGSRHQALQWILHSRSRAALVHGFTLLAFSLTTFTLCCCFVRVEDWERLKPLLWKKHVHLLNYLHYAV